MVFKRMADDRHQWECKECHRAVDEKQNMAYHLVDRVLYGWCEPCYQRKAKAS